MWDRIKTAGGVTYRVLKDAARSYGTERVGRMAAAVAYRTIFAVAPLLLLAVGVFGLVVGDSAEARVRIFEAIESLVGGQVAGAVEDLVVSAIESSDVTAILGFVLFAWAASTLFLEVQNNLNDIFGVPYHETAGFVGLVRRRAIGMAWSLSFGLILVAVWVINGAWGWIASLLPDRLDWVLELLTRLASLAVLPMVFVLAFKTLSRAPVRRRAVWLGGVFTSVVFLITAIGAGIYFAWDDQTSASQIAGSFFVLLLLAYFLSSVTLFGAQVTRAYNEHLESQ
jgi:membrane protein